MAFGLDGDKWFVILSSLKIFEQGTEDLLLIFICIPHCQPQVFILIAEDQIQSWKFLIPKI